MNFSLGERVVMKVTNNKLAHAVRVSLIASAATVAFAGVASAQTSASTDNQDGTKTTSVGKVTITGSRIKRAAAEGNTPVTILSRQDLERSGKASIADVLRDTPTASFGNFKPQSGSSAQALATIDLAGMGSERTLVLVDGRRIAKAPFSDGSADLNAIPAAAVERVEILTDGASAVYGSDAIGGVVNVVLRKNFDGVELKAGIGQTAVKGGDTSEWSAVFGSVGERSSVTGGISGAERGMVFTRDQIGYTKGISTYGNNYQVYDIANDEVLTATKAIPGFACNSDGFWMQANGRCSFDFNAVAANEASLKSKGIYLHGDFKINDNWTLYGQGMQQNIRSFGRYAPTPAALVVEDNSPADVIKGDGYGTLIYHRLAAFGARDTNTDGTVSDAVLGAKGTVGRFDVDFGLHRSSYTYSEKGTGYTVNPLLVAALNDGSYDVKNPFADPRPDVTATISRDSFFKVDELFANTNFDLFSMAGGTSSAFVGVEHRKERFADIYDSLSEAGLIDGSSGNSAAGRRNVSSVAAEWLLPMFKGFELSLAGRYDKYSDFGNNFSPKVSIRYQPLTNLTFRGSYGEGFRAPTISILHQKTSFSAESVQDDITCGEVGASCQVDTYFQANPNLQAEKSKQWLLGFSWDITNWMNFTYDYRDIKIQDRIRAFSGDELVQRFRDPSYGVIPPGMSVVTGVDGSIRRIFAGYGNEGDEHTTLSEAKLRTQFNLGGGRLNNALIVNYTHKKEIDGSDKINWLGNPQYRAVLQNTYSIGDWTFGTSTDFIAKQHKDPGYAKGLHVGGYTTNNVFMSYNAPWNATVQVGVNNVGNRYPQLVTYDGRPWNFYLYDAYGRTVYFKYTQRF